MKYLIAFLFSTVLIVSSITAQSSNSTSTDDDTSTNSTDTTTVPSTNTTTVPSTDTTDITAGNGTGPIVEMRQPNMTDLCIALFNNCTNSVVMSPSTCIYLETSLLGCLQKRVDEGIGCADEDITAINDYCFGNRFLSLAYNSMVSDNCQLQTAYIVEQNGAGVDDITEESGAYCTYLDMYETDFKTSSINGVCTETEYIDMHTTICFACRGAIASLALVLTMVVAQWIL